MFPRRRRGNIKNHLISGNAESGGEDHVPPPEAGEHKKHLISGNAEIRGEEAQETMAAIQALAFTKVWTNPSDFPTVETSETQVRADMQRLYDEIRDYINGTLLARLNAAEFWFGTQAEYDAIESKDPTVIYCIEEAGA